MSCEIKDMIIDHLRDWLDDEILVQEGKMIKSPKGNLFKGDNSDMVELYNETLMWIKEDHKQRALSAGIPLSVIEGKTKLRDHFSKEYINYKCNRENKE